MDERFKKILTESAKLFQKCGIRSVSMDDICREMGISKKTMYQYVESKADLIAKILEHSHEQHETAMDYKNRYDNLNAIDILLEVSKHVCEDMQRFNPSITFDLQKFYPEIFKTMLDKKKAFIFEKIKCNIERGIAEEIYRPDLDVDLVAQLYVQRLVDFHNPEFIASGNLSFEKVFRVMFENHIRGISNAKGVEYFEKQKQFLNDNI